MLWCIRTTIRLDDDLLDAARRRAAERRTTLTKLIEDALRAELARRPASGAERVELPTFRGDGLQPGMDLDDGAALLDVLEADLPLHKRR